MPDGFMKEKIKIQIFNLIFEEKRFHKKKLLPLKNALKLQNEHRVARKTTLFGDFLKFFFTKQETYRYQ